MQAPMLLTIDELTAANLLVKVNESLGEPTLFTYVNVIIPVPIKGKLSNFSIQRDDGAIEDAELQETDSYEIDSGIFIGMQRNSHVVKILWCKWAYFFYNAESFVVEHLRLIIHRDLVNFLFTYVDRSIAWDPDINPLAKYLSALVSHSYESQLCFDISNQMGLKISEIYDGFDNSFAKTYARGSLWRQAFYLVFMLIIAHIAKYEDAVHENGAFENMRSWIEGIFPREGVFTPWIRGNIDKHIGLHDFFDDLDNPIGRFNLKYQFVYHVAQAAQDLLVFSGAPRVNVETVLDNYLRFLNGEPRSHFTPINLRLSAPRDPLGELTISPMSSIGILSPIESSRKKLLAEFEDVRFVMTSDEMMPIDKLITLLEKSDDENDD
jgi:hypothetical protein